VSRLTRVQSEAFGPIVLGHSLTVFDRTGSGKTFAYLVPTLARLAQERFTESASCLIVVPTQELCKQIGSVLVSLDPTINVLLAFGASDPGFSNMLRQGPQIVIGTGGRISNLVMKNAIDPSNIKILVIDELDALLDHVYRKAVTPLLSAITPGSSQVLGFGATRTPELLDILSKFSALSNVTDVDLLDSTYRHQIAHSVMKVPGSPVERLGILVSILCTTKHDKTIVFANTIDEARTIVQHPLLSMKARIFHSGLTPVVRDSLLSSFKAGKISILVCTDINARGIDIPDVDLVISFRPPVDAVTYVHRAGRTGRMKSIGKSILLFSASEKPLVEEIARVGKLKFENESVPKYDERRDAAVQVIISEAIKRGQNADQRLKSQVDKLLAESPELCETIVSKCVNGVLGDFGEPPSSKQHSILSGERGYTPMLFVDPGRSVLKNRADLDTIIANLGLNIGLVSVCESGFIVDLSTEQALRIAGTVSHNGSLIETFVLKKLPKLLKDKNTVGRKYRGILPWRQGRGKAVANSSSRK
jgi:ATP-dependent RNA helicase DeaD